MLSWEPRSLPTKCWINSLFCFACVVSGLPIKLPLSQPVICLTFTCWILSPIPSGEWVRGCVGLSHQLDLKHNNQSKTFFCPSSLLSSSGWKTETKKAHDIYCNWSAIMSQSSELSRLSIGHNFCLLTSTAYSTTHFNKINVFLGLIQLGLWKGVGRNQNFTYFCICTLWGINGQREAEGGRNLAQSAYC